MPEIIMDDLKSVWKKYLIPKNKYKEWRKILEVWIKYKTWSTPLKIDEWLSQACWAMNEKFCHDDKNLGGQIEYSNENLGTCIRGSETTDFGFLGTGTEYVLMLYLKNGFVVPNNIDLFFDDSFKYFGVA